MLRRETEKPQKVFGGGALSTISLTGFCRTPPERVGGDGWVGANDRNQADKAYSNLTYNLNVSLHLSIWSILYE
jgi:hypothetical protein